MIRHEAPPGALLTGALRLWIAVTVVFVLCCSALYVHSGWEGVAFLIQTGPASIKEQTLACVALVWLSLGTGLILLNRWRLRTERCLEVLGCMLILLLYVNILRERVHFGDAGAYLGAALDLHDGKPFHARYISPPLLATLGQPLLWLGARGFKGVLWLANIVSLVAFFWLLKAALLRYGFGRRLSIGIVFLFMLVNVPILRTLAYVQINLHVMNLILLTILLLRRYPVLSALCLAFAAHLKASPVVVALPFLGMRNGRWTAAFLAGLVGLAGLTAAFYGWRPFVDAFQNMRNSYGVNGINFRDSSLDSLIRSTALLWGADASPFVVLLPKIAVLGAIFATAVSNIRHATFVHRGDYGSRALNGVPAFLVLMLLASPIVWEHHAVFVALPYLVIAKKLDSSWAWTWYGAAYTLEFLIPTFDFYPWSFGRLVSPLILISLMFKCSSRRDAASFLKLRDRVDGFSSGRATA